MFDRDLAELYQIVFQTIKLLLKKDDNPKKPIGFTTGR